MMFLPTMAVIFAGFTGGHHARVEKQVQGVVKALHVDVKPLPQPVVKSLTHHDATTRDRVRKLNVDAVIAAEVTSKGALRIVIYDRDGKLASLAESSLSNDQLSADDLDVLRENLSSDLEPFLGAAPAPEPAPAPVPAPTKKPAFDEEAELRSLGEDPKKAKTPAKTVVAAAPPVAKAPAKPTKAAPPTIDMDDSGQASDDESPLGSAKGSRAPAPTHAPAPAAVAEDSGSTSSDSTATASADDSSGGAVSASDIEAMMGSASETAEVPASTTTQPELHLGAEAGFGIATRSFATPSALAGYGSAPVGAVHAAVDVQPNTRVRLHLSAERTVGMTTPLDSGDASTVVSRWEASGGYAVTHGRVQISPQLGVGRRSFSVRSEDPNRSPDTSYNYLVVGARGRMNVGSHVGLSAFAALEPVVSGSEGTEMALGEATRWAVDGGAALDVKFGHALVRAAADYQQFNWSWSMAGTRGSGGATDAYLTGSLSIGAEY